MVPEHTSHSKVELQTKLNNPWIVARRDDASKVARIDDLRRCWVNATARCEESIHVADRIREVRVIEQIEELSAKFEIAGFGQRKELSERKIHIHLSRPAQTVSANVPDVRPCDRGRRGSTRAGDRLTSGD